MKSVKHFLMIHLAAPMAYAVIRLLGSTVRLEVVGGGEEEKLAQAGKPGIICCWHGRVLYLPYYFSKVRRHSHMIDVLASPSHDGEFVARVSSLFGYGVARGSSYKNPRTALRELTRRAGQGRWPGIIADGSRGPAFEAQPGSVMLAKLTGAPVIPITVSFDRQWILNSWDKMIIPKPFCRAVVVYGQPVTFSPGGGREELDNKLAELNHVLDQITDQADNHFSNQ